VTTVTQAIAIIMPTMPQAATPVGDGDHCVCCTGFLRGPTTADEVIHKRYAQWG
jgi:hypothetical protein